MFPRHRSQRGQDRGEQQEQKQNRVNLQREIKIRVKQTAR